MSSVCKTSWSPLPAALSQWHWPLIVAVISKVDNCPRFSDTTPKTPHITVHYWDSACADPCLRTAVWLHNGRGIPIPRGPSASRLYVKGECPEDHEEVGTYFLLIQYVRSLDLIYSYMHARLLQFDKVNPAYTPQRALGTMTSSCKTVQFLV